jgi:hypothetical protein
MRSKDRLQVLVGEVDPYGQTLVRERFQEYSHRVTTELSAERTFDAARSRINNGNELDVVWIGELNSLVALYHLRTLRRESPTLSVVISYEKNQGFTPTIIPFFLREGALLIPRSLRGPNVEGIIQRVEEQKRVVR